MKSVYRTELSKEIVALHLEGVKNADIARQTKCSPANVCKTIRRHIKIETNDFRSAPLTISQIEYIQAEAKKSNVTYDEMARAMLVDYLENVTHET